MSYRNNVACVRAEIEPRRKVYVHCRINHILFPSYSNDFIIQFYISDRAINIIY